MSPAVRPEGTDDSIFNIDIQYSRVTKGLVNEDDLGRSVCQPQLSETDYLINRSSRRFCCLPRSPRRIAIPRAPPRRFSFLVECRVLVPIKACPQFVNPIIILFPTRPTQPQPQTCTSFSRPRLPPTLPHISLLRRMNIRTRATTTSTPTYLDLQYRHTPPPSNGSSANRPPRNSRKANIATP